MYNNLFSNGYSFDNCLRYLVHLLITNAAKFFISAVVEFAITDSKKMLKHKINMTDSTFLLTESFFD